MLQELFFSSKTSSAALLIDKEIILVISLDLSMET